MNNLLIYTIGYESRAGFIPGKNIARQQIGIQLEMHKGLSWEQNLRLAEERSDALTNTENALNSIKDSIVSEMGSNESEHQPYKIALDISSMPRSLIAGCIGLILPFMQENPITLDIVYAPAKYTPPPSDTPHYFELSPLPGWEGWTAFPERPLSLITGVGYEANLTLSALEEIDPSGTWVFLPNGNDPRFRKDVDRLNRDFLDMINDRHKVEYTVTEPHQAYTDLREIAETLIRYSRVTLLPCGPKMFTALCMIVKCELGDEVAIWRASWHGHGIPYDIEANGEIAWFHYSGFRQEPGFFEVSD